MPVERTPSHTVLARLLLQLLHDPRPPQEAFTRKASSDDAEVHMPHLHQNCAHVQERVQGSLGNPAWH